MLTKIELCTHIRNVLCILMYMRIYGISKSLLIETKFKKRHFLVSLGEATLTHTADMICRLHSLTK